MKLTDRNKQVSNRNTEQRRQFIFELLQQKKEISVDQLACELNTSEVTIRKDLNNLEREGKLLRRYGGAVVIPCSTEQQTVSLYKHAIAKEAARLVKNNSRIIIDSGNTTSALAPELNGKQQLVIMTNSLKVANQVLKLSPEPNLLMTGGTWDSASESFQGKVAEQALSAYDFDQLFVGADGIDFNHGTTSFNELLYLSQAMANAAKQVIVMLEANKIGRKIPNIELAWQHIDILITDDRLDQKSQQQISERGVQLICATLTTLGDH